MEYKIGKNRNKTLKLLSDEQILAELGRRFEAHRLTSRIPDKEIFETGGVKKDALAHFKKGRNISLLNFIKILRGAGLLSDLERLIPETDEFSPSDLVSDSLHSRPKRIRNSGKKLERFRWGDE